MANWNAVDYPVEQIRQWIADGKTHKWIGEQLGVRAVQISKVCKKHGIKCQRTGPRAGAGHPEWKGGRVIEKKTGAVLIYSPGHPCQRKNTKYIYEHRLVMEQHLGRYLRPDEVVHHKNKNTSDNRIENLELFASNSEHLRKELNGKVPNWTEDGKHRISEGVRESWKQRRLKKQNHQQLEFDASENK